MPGSSLPRPLPPLQYLWLQEKKKTPFFLLGVRSCRLARAPPALRGCGERSPRRVLAAAAGKHPQPLTLPLRLHPGPSRTRRCRSAPLRASPRRSVNAPSGPSLRSLRPRPGLEPAAPPAAAGPAGFGRPRKRGGRFRGPAVSSARPAPHLSAPLRAMLLARALRSAAAAAAAGSLRRPPRRLLSAASPLPRALLPPPAAAPALARSLWQLRGAGGRTALLRPRRGSAGGGVSCGCGGLHTEGERRARPRRAERGGGAPGGVRGHAPPRQHVVAVAGAGPGPSRNRHPPLCPRQATKPSRSSWRTRSRRRRRSRSTSRCPRCPAGGSWRSTAPRPGWCGRSPGRSKWRVPVTGSAVGNGDRIAPGARVTSVRVKSLFLPF